MLRCSCGEAQAVMRGPQSGIAGSRCYRNRCNRCGARSNSGVELLTQAVAANQSRVAQLSTGIQVVSFPGWSWCYWHVTFLLAEKLLCLRRVLGEAYEVPRVRKSTHSRRVQDSQAGAAPGRPLSWPATQSSGPDFLGAHHDELLHRSSRALIRRMRSVAVDDCLESEVHQ
jgi:hypothetical protein